MEELAHILGCKVFSQPMKCLRFSLVAGFKSIVIWDTMLEKVEWSSMTEMFYPRVLRLAINRCFRVC